MDKQTQFKHQVKAIYRLLSLLFIVVILVSICGIYIIADPSLSFFRNTTFNENTMIVFDENEDKIENGIHLKTGLIEAEGLMEVVNNCTNCHSAKLVIQNRMNRERWIATIRWMQETQNLWDLGTNEEIIINYLVTNYPPSKNGRRKTLTRIEWYDLQD